MAKKLLAKALRIVREMARCAYPISECGASRLKANTFSAVASAFGQNTLLPHTLSEILGLYEAYGD